MAPKSLKSNASIEVEQSMTGVGSLLVSKDAYYNAIDYSFAKDNTCIEIKSHGIRLDQNQKPKNFYLLQVSFKNEKVDKKKNQKSGL